MTLYPRDIIQRRSFSASRKRDPGFAALTSEDSLDSRILALFCQFDLTSDDIEQLSRKFYGDNKENAIRDCRVHHRKMHRGRIAINFDYDSSV